VSSLQRLELFENHASKYKKPGESTSYNPRYISQKRRPYAYAIPTLFLSYFQPPLGGDHVRRLFFVVAPVGDATVESVPA
jgi:hypothetical protein